MWEVVVENENSKNDKLVKEISSERKTKSIKKRLDLFRKCRKTILSQLTDWKETPGVEEEKVFRNLKELSKKEHIVKEMSKQKLRRLEDRRNYKKLEKEEDYEVAEVSLPLVPTKVMCKVQKQWKPRVADLGCDNLLNPSSTADGGTHAKLIFTKPQHVQDGAAAEAVKCLGPALPTNRERVAGTAEARVGHVANGDVEQTGLAAQPLLRRKLGEQLPRNTWKF